MTMRLPGHAIDNYQFTVIMVLLLVISGVVSLMTMPRSEDPQVANSGGSVYVLYPGANPMDMEQLIVDPLEKALNELEDIKKISSSMEDGLAVIHTEFETGTDPDEKYSDILQKVNAVRSDLPDDIMALMTEKWAISNVNIIQVALVSETASYRDLKYEAERLEKGLRLKKDVHNEKSGEHEDEGHNKPLDYVFFLRVTYFVSQHRSQLVLFEDLKQCIEQHDSFRSADTGEICVGVSRPFAAVHYENPFRAK